MGVYSGNGMAPAQPIPGYRVFKGSPARANAQAECSRLIAELDPDRKELMRRKIAQAWKAGMEPQQVYDFVYKAMEAFRAAQEPRPPV